MHYTLLITFLLLTSAIAVGQTIKWTPDRKLMWEDFQGTADTSSKYHAQTQSGVNYSYRWQSAYNKTTYTFEVFSYCDKSLSWVKQGKSTDGLLAHEQLHFDISELHARKLKKTISETTFTDRYDSEIKDLFHENQRARVAMQEQYDRETQHMTNRKEQLKWQQYIADELKSLQNYQDSEVLN